MKAGDTRAEFWCMTKINSRSTEKSLISMHALHLNNNVEMQIQTRYFTCAGTHGNRKNRLLRHAHSSTLYFMHIKYIYDMSAPFLALAGSKGGVLFLRCWIIAGSSPFRCSTRPFRIEMYDVTVISCKLWC